MPAEPPSPAVAERAGLTAAREATIRRRLAGILHATGNTWCACCDDLPGVLDTLDQTRAALRDYAAGRCYPCGWPLAASADQGCIIGNCSFRPSEHSAEHDPWLARQRFVMALLAPAGAPGAGGGGA